MAASTALSAKPSTTSVRWREPVEVSSVGRASVESTSDGGATGNLPQNNRPLSGSCLGSGPATPTFSSPPPGPGFGHGDSETRFDTSDHRGSPSGVPENVIIMPVEDVQTSTELLGRKVIRSRSRPRRADEPPPFLSVDTLPVDKVVVDGKTPSFKSSGGPSTGKRFTGSPKKYHKDPAGLNNSMNSSIGGRKTPQSQKPGSARASSRASSASMNYNSFFTHKNAAFLSAASPPSLWSSGNKFWPHQSPAGDKRRVPAFPPVMAVEGNSAKPNQLVTQPFKHDSDASPLVERCVSPSQELKERTLGAVKEVARDLLKKGGSPSSPTRNGRLLKGKLKPLQTFKLSGPNIDECMGVQAEERPSYTPSQARLLQRKRELLSMIPPDVLQQRPVTQESFHHTSIASNLSDDRYNELESPMRTDDTIMELPPNAAPTVHMSAFTRIPANSLASISTSDVMADGTMSPSGGRVEGNMPSPNHEESGTATSAPAPLEASAPPAATMSDYLNEGGAASILSDMVDKVKHSAQRVSEEGTEAVDDAYHESMFVDTEQLGSRSATPGNRSVVASDDGMMFESASQRSVRFSDSDTIIPTDGEEDLSRPGSQASMQSSTMDGNLVRIDVTADGAVNQHQVEEAVINIDSGSEHEIEIDNKSELPDQNDDVQHEHKNQVGLHKELPSVTTQNLELNGQENYTTGDLVAENSTEIPVLVTHAGDGKANVTLLKTQAKNDVDIGNEINNNLNTGKQVEHNDSCPDQIASDDQEDQIGNASVPSQTLNNDQTQSNEQNECVSFFKTEHVEAENVKPKNDGKDADVPNEEQAGVSDSSGEHLMENSNKSSSQDVEQNKTVNNEQVQQKHDNELNEQPSAINVESKAESTASNAELTEDVPAISIHIEVTQQQTKDETVLEADVKTDSTEIEAEEESKVEEKGKAEEEEDGNAGESCNKKYGKDCKEDDDNSGPGGSHGNDETGENGQSGNHGNNDGDESSGQDDGNHSNQGGSDSGSGKEQADNATDNEQKNEPNDLPSSIFPSHLHYKNKVSKCWYGDLEDDVPEIEDSVLFCAICGLDEDYCLCPHSNVAPNRTQSGRIYPTCEKEGTTNNRLKSAPPGGIERNMQSTENDTDLSLSDNKIVMEYKALLGHDTNSGCFSSELSSSPRKQSSSNQAHFLLRGVSVMSGDERIRDGTDTRMENFGGDSGCESEHADGDNGISGDGEDASKISEDDETRADPSTLKVVAETKKLSRPRSAKKKPAPSPAPFPPLCFRINVRPPAGKLFYFAYGVDMNPKRMTTYLGSTVERRWGVLFGFKLRFNKRGSDLAAGGFPNIEFCPESSVEGCVYVISQDQLKTLDMFMGSPQFYTHAMFPVWMSNCYQPEEFGVAQYCVPALTYIALDKWTHTDTSNPLSCHYSLEQSLKGSDLLTNDYVQHMKAQLVT